ncbi:10926_t:CDS:2 [Funneliformis geosporum]|uniref:1797_t:CDS:1 n=1 Tax=Funneliformis geosporum TaxID=1117311 RepID=A0A9W4SCW6_9GLOM|nr:10926_t:CDS:2 [Funneliformis geosporum]CAI2163878.1 1797_t:CDS:2 [Funneliformis geosporum]
MLLLHILRTLQFTFAAIVFVNDAIISTGYLEYMNGSPPYPAYLLIPNIITLLLSGYYMISIEKQWKKVPNKWDFICQGFLLTIWVLYSVFKLTHVTGFEIWSKSEMLPRVLPWEKGELETLVFVGIEIGNATIAFGYVNMFLCFISFITLIWTYWSSQSRGDKIDVITANHVETKFSPQNIV